MTQLSIRFRRVGGTTLLIAFLAYSSQLFIIIPYYRYTPDLTPAWLLAFLVPFNALVALIFTNYYLCVRTDPGSVPREWEPDWAALDESGAGLEVKRHTGAPRYCRLCDAYKPPRAHHCRSCGRCVLRMDHHCPWVANCVGHGNYGHFVRFLASVDVTCSFHLVMITLRVADYWSPHAYWVRRRCADPYYHVTRAD